MQRPETTDREAQVWEALNALIHCMRAHHRLVERRIDGMGVHHSQHRMLMQLNRMGPMPSQKEIAQVLDVSPACVARTLKALSASGLIDKREGADNRRNEISITPEGQRMIDDTLSVFLEIDRGMFVGVSEEDLAKLIQIMRHVQQNLAAMERPESAPNPPTQTEENRL